MKCNHKNCSAPALCCFTTEKPDFDMVYICKTHAENRTMEKCGYRYVGYLQQPGDVLIISGGLGDIVKVIDVDAS